MLHRDAHVHVILDDVHGPPCGRIVWGDGLQLVHSASNVPRRTTHWTTSSTTKQHHICTVSTLSSKNVCVRHAFCRKPLGEASPGGERSKIGTFQCQGRCLRPGQVGRGGRVTAKLDNRLPPRELRLGFGFRVSLYDSPVFEDHSHFSPKNLSAADLSC